MSKEYILTKNGGSYQFEGLNVITLSRLRQFYEIPSGISEIFVQVSKNRLAGSYKAKVSRGIKLQDESGAWATFTGKEEAGEEVQDALGLGDRMFYLRVQTQ